ncbi:Flp pilus assembly protein TadG [uncultured Avibacterium sp.]|uniref:Flp pilus assembly protein TadG n=1 Tax=uncultured Avibacterium sp. TaxID=1936169 RepID=A0A486XG77_9PAST|nr:Flp pilus assembly protein TadG [uncultured Avibacterium sp.]
MLNSRIYRKVATSFSSFIEQQKGVYGIIMGMITVFLLVIIGFTIDGSGILLDRARLSDSLEQATLAITSENNTYRNDEFVLGKVSTQNGQKVITRNNKQIKQRDEDIIKAYMTSYANSYSKVKSVDYHCDKETNRITCYAQGTLERNSLLPISINKNVFIPTHIDIGQYGSAFKEGKNASPLDIMFAVNFSSDMFSGIADNLPGPYCSGEYRWKSDNITIERHFEILKKCGNTPWATSIFESLKEYVNMLEIFKSQSNGQPNNNRIGLTAFTLGAQPINEGNNVCALPFKFPSNKKFNDPLVESQTFVSTKLRNNWEYKVTTVNLTNVKENLKEMLEKINRHLVTRTNNFDSMEPGILVAKYLPLSLDIWPEDLKQDFADGKQGKKRAWYDIRPEKQYLDLDLDSPNKAVYDTIDQIVAPTTREKYTAYRIIKASIEAKGKNYQPTASEKKSLSDALDALAQDKNVRGYGVNDEATRQSWLTLNKKNGTRVGLCFDYSKTNTTQDDSAWFTNLSDFTSKLDYNPRSTHMGGGKLGISGLLMGAYNMVANITALPKGSQNKKRVLVFVDAAIQDDISVFNTVTKIKKDSWQYTASINPYTTERGDLITINEDWTLKNSRYISSSWYFNRFNQKVDESYIQYRNVNPFYGLITPAFLKKGSSDDPASNSSYPSPAICDAIRARFMSSPFQDPALGLVDPEIVYIQYRSAKLGNSYRSQTDRYWEQCADKAFFIGISDNGAVDQSQDTEIQEYFKSLQEQSGTGSAGKEIDEVGRSLAK